MTDKSSVILLLLEVTPLLWICLYNQPSSDDYNFANLSIEKGFWGAQVSNYFSWAGRYFSTALLSVSPLVFYSFAGYKILTAFFICGFIVTVFWLSGKIFPGLDGSVRLCFSSFFLFIYFLQVPEPRQGLFWLTGSITYQVANILAMALWGFWAEYFRTGRKIYFALCVLSVFGIIGSNETAMVLTDFSLLFAVGAYWLTHRRMHPGLLALGGFALLFSILVAAAPGNLCREAFFPMKHHLASSVNIALNRGALYWFRWTFGIHGMFWIEWLMVDFIYRRVVPANQAGTLPIFKLPAAFILLLIIPFVGIFPAVWATGAAPPDRTYGEVYFYFLCALFCFFVALSHYLRRLDIFKNIVFPPGIRTAMLLLGVYLVVLRPNHIVPVYDDLLSGRAKEYNRQMTERRDYIAGFRGNTCVLRPIHEIPNALYLDDIVPDAKDWKDEAFSEYYGKKCVLAPSTGLGVDR